MVASGSLASLCAQVQFALDERGLPLPPVLVDHLGTCQDCQFAAQLSSVMFASPADSIGSRLSAALGSGVESGTALLLDRYRLDVFLGGGSQGRVYLATDVKVRDTRVALKIVRLDHDSVDEVANARQINHPHVCRIHHTMEYGALRLIEMEYIEGPTLAERLGALSFEEAVAIFRALCQGMIAVHDHGILHLDLKPKNIMLRHGSQPVITDFGLSTRMGGAPRGWTKKYVAPELEQGGPVDVRTDVYSLGVILSELIPQPARAVQAVIGRATAEQPQDRFPGVRGLLAGFEGALRRRQRLLWGGQAALLALLLATLFGMATYSVRYREQRALAGMVRLPGGQFEMGSTEDEIAAAYQYCGRLGQPDCDEKIYRREYPKREIEVPPFALDRWEAKNRDVATWLDRKRQIRVDSEKKIWDGDGTLLLDLGDVHSGIDIQGDRLVPRKGYEDRPVVLVTWEGAMRYCQHLDRRLPMAAEWESAARGTERRRFPWGEKEPECSGVVFDRVPDGQCAPLAEDRPSPVGQAPQDHTPEGIFDLGGNVQEWVKDESPSDRAPYPSPVDRVIRGGGYNLRAHVTRAAGISKRGPQETMLNVGFRCARPLSR